MQLPNWPLIVIIVSYCTSVCSSNSSVLPPVVHELTAGTVANSNYLSNSTANHSSVEAEAVSSISGGANASGYSLTAVLAVVVVVGLLVVLLRALRMRATGRRRSPSYRYFPLSQHEDGTLQEVCGDRNCTMDESSDDEIAISNFCAKQRRSMAEMKEKETSSKAPDRMRLLDASDEELIS